MNPLTLSAQFAAYTWFSGQQDNAGKTSAAARQFARENWEFFLPLAHPGLGRLLLKIANCHSPCEKVTHKSAQKFAAPSLVQSPFCCN